MCPLALQLGIGPGRLLAAGVLGEVDLIGTGSECLPRIQCPEVDLGHLPVALVQVREVVEGGVEPVLDREPAGVRGIGGQMCVDARWPAVVPASELPLVVAAGTDRVARKVEVVARPETPQVARRRRAPHDPPVRTTKYDARPAEDDVYSRRPVRLARAARPLLRLERKNRGV